MTFGMVDVSDNESYDHETDTEQQLDELASPQVKNVRTVKTRTGSRAQPRKEANDFKPKNMLLLKKTLSPPRNAFGNNAASDEPKSCEQLINCISLDEEEVAARRRRDSGKKNAMLGEESNAINILSSTGKSQLPRKSGRYDASIGDDEDLEEDGIECENIDDSSRSSTESPTTNESMSDNRRSSDEDGLENFAKDKIEYGADGWRKTRSKPESKQAVGGWFADGPSPDPQQTVSYNYNDEIVSGINPASLARASFNLIAHASGSTTELVQCTIRRDRTNIDGTFYPTYELILENGWKPLITARKNKMNRKANYHFFDMTRGQVGTKTCLSKKSGNYMGKLRTANSSRTSYVLLTNKQEPEEIAAVSFDKTSLLGQITDGSQPRKMRVIIPSMNEDKTPMVHKRSQSEKSCDTHTSDTSFSIDSSSNKNSKQRHQWLSDREKDAKAPSLVDFLDLYSGNSFFKPSKDCLLLQSKDPVFDNGNYRLNFKGRVRKPSVKNFQLIECEGDIDDILCQFGKVDENTFRLDFKAPFNAAQAFSLALAQFDL